MPEVVYRSTHPDVLTHWQRTASAEAQQAWLDKVNAAIADLGFPGRRFATSNETRVIGVEHPTDEPIPAGWRRDRRLPSAIVPARRYSAGKKIGERLDALSRPDPRKALPGGMPEIALNKAESVFLYAGVTRHGDAVYVTYSGDIDKSYRVHIDPRVWESVRLSEYYAVLEAEEVQAS
jgi:hypothetical protein